MQQVKPVVLDHKRGVVVQVGHRRAGLRRPGDVDLDVGHVLVVFLGGPADDEDRVADILARVGHPLHGGEHIPPVALFEHSGGEFQHRRPGRFFIAHAPQHRCADERVLMR